MIDVIISHPLPAVISDRRGYFKNRSLESSQTGFIQQVLLLILIWLLLLLVSHLHLEILQHAELCLLLSLVTQRAGMSVHIHEPVCEMHGALWKPARLKRCLDNNKKKKISEHILQDPLIFGICFLTSLFDLRLALKSATAFINEWAAQSPHSEKGWVMSFLRGFNMFSLCLPQSENVRS